jgi:hypothetical protein
MTKLIALRITVAADDAVETQAAKQRLATLVTERGTETIGENGAGGRIHWGTAEVLQGPDKVPARKSRARSTSPTGQTELPT